MRYRVPFGREEWEFDLPAGLHGTLVESRPMSALADPAVSIEQALHAPVGAAPLSRLARPGDRVCVLFTDATRASPDHLFMPAILRELECAGVHAEDITLLCAVGMHRPSTSAEKIEKLGAAIVGRYRVMDHNAQEPAGLVDLGQSEGGVPLSVNRLAYESDLLIATGLVEPHQYAGYSGGPKTLSVGAAGEAMIAYTHGPALVDHPGTRLGQLEGNLFHAAVLEAARRANLRFIVNGILDDAGRLVAVRAGDPLAAYRELVEIARRLYEVPIGQQFDIAIGGVGHPKDANLYQATRAASYLYFAPTPVVRPGGVLIIPAPCPEGAGAGVGEQRFLRSLRDAPDVAAVLQDARRHGYPPGQQRAFIMAKVLENCTVIIAGAQDPQIVRQTKMLPADTMQEALALAQQRLGADLDVLIVPHALHTLPIVRNANHL